MKKSLYKHAHGYIMCKRNLCLMSVSITSDKDTANFMFNVFRPK